MWIFPAFTAVAVDDGSKTKNFDTESHEHTPVVCLVVSGRDWWVLPI